MSEEVIASVESVPSGMVGGTQAPSEHDENQPLETPTQEIEKIGDLEVKPAANPTTPSKVMATTKPGIAAAIAAFG